MRGCNGWDGGLRGRGYRRLSSDGKLAASLEFGPEINLGFILSRQPFMCRAFPQRKPKSSLCFLPDYSFIMYQLTIENPEDGPLHSRQHPLIRIDRIDFFDRILKCNIIRRGPGIHQVRCKTEAVNPGIGIRSDQTAE